MALDTLTDPPVKALVVYNSNPAAVAPNQNSVMRGLRRDDLFTVVIEQTRTDTADCADILLPAEELERRRARLRESGGYRYPPSQTPWQEIQRALVGQLDTGAILEGAEKYQSIAETMGVPRDNH